MSQPLIPGLADRGAEPHGPDCDCCAGLGRGGLAAPAVRAGLAAVDYRPGRFADFRDGQLARLSSAELPALARLRSRDTDDFSVALIDAWAVTLDVLGFYQERAANEAWFGTALERRSLVELGALIGYQLAPGVAAATDLVFQLEAPPGAAPPVAAVVIEAGSRVQSVPGPGETAQTFETVEEIKARVAWNAIAPRRTRLIAPANGDTGTWLAGIVTGLRVGDPIIIVGRERLELDAGSERWDFRRLTRVAPDNAADRTWVEWTPGLGSLDPPGLPAQEGHRVFALRARAALFGWNAPHPMLLAEETRVRYGLTDDDWPFTIDAAARQIAIDGVQDGWVAGSLVALTRPAAVVELYRIEQAVDDGKSAYAISARATLLTLDTGEQLNEFETSYRSVAAYGRSEELAFAETPILEPVSGDRIELGVLAGELPPGRRLIVRGPRAAAMAIADGLSLAVTGAGAQPLLRGTVVTLLAPPAPVTAGSITLAWRVRVPGGIEGVVTAALSAFRYVAAAADAEIVAEPAILQSVEAADATHSRLILVEALLATYDRTATVHANVAAATHGETTEEILGDGDAARPFAAYMMKQKPLTHVAAPTPTGNAPALELRIDDVLWRAVPSLYGAAPRDRVYALHTQDDGASVVQFGDGVQGARPPSGRNNVVATYRKGIGLAGLVGAGTLTTALDKPLGLKSVFNPVAATGGDDAETLADVRRNAPVTVLTLGRVVSLRNYEDFARGFAGIAQARADWVWDGTARRILVTVAGPGGASVIPGSALHVNLLAALRGLGDPFVRLALETFRPATFRLKLRVRVDPAYVVDDVLAATEAALRGAYGFERGFAPLVAGSGVIATVQSVAGVIAVDLDLLYRTVPPSSAVVLHQRLLAQGAALLDSGLVAAAEMLTLDPAPLDLAVMP